MKKLNAVIGTVLALTLFACGENGEDEKKTAPEPPSSIYSVGVSGDMLDIKAYKDGSYIYRVYDEGSDSNEMCDTGEMRIQNLENLCQVLNNEEVNYHCNKVQRRIAYQNFCVKGQSRAGQSYSSRSSYGYSAKDSATGCSTGQIESNSHEERCEKLLDESLNNNCAPFMRRDAYIKICGDLNVDGTLPVKPEVTKNSPTADASLVMKCQGTVSGNGIVKNVDESFTWNGKGSRVEIILPFEDVDINPHGEISIRFRKDTIPENNEVKLYARLIDNNKVLASTTKAGGEVSFYHKDPKYHDRIIDIRCVPEKTLTPPAFQKNEAGYEIACKGRSESSALGESTSMRGQFTWDGLTEVTHELEFSNPKAQVKSVKVKLAPSLTGPKIQIIAENMDGHVDNIASSANTLYTYMKYISAWDRRGLEIICSPQAAWEEAAKEFSKHFKDDK